MSEPCPTCEVLREQVVWLRAQLEVALRVQPPPPPPAAPIAGTPGVSLAAQPTEAMLEQAGIFVDGRGMAMVYVDGQAVPLTEYRRGQRAIEQALAGKPIEMEGT